MTPTPPKAPAPDTASTEAQALVPIIVKAPEFSNLAEALAAFQAELPGIRKGNTAKVESNKGSYSYDYADLADVSDAVLPRLGAYGLAWITMPDTSDDGTITLTWRLVHGSSGDSLEGSVPVGRKGDRWQDLGSAITYARRYTLVSVTGVAPGGDDNDGRGVNAGAGTHSQDEPAQIIMLNLDLYDLNSIDSAKAAEQMFYVARGNGHLAHAVETPAGLVPFAEYLRAEAGKFTEQTKGEESQDPEGDAEAAERAAVAEHEAELAAQASEPTEDEAHVTEQRALDNEAGV